MCIARSNDLNTKRSKPQLGGLAVIRGRLLMQPSDRIEEQFVLASEVEVFEIVFQNEKHNGEKLVGGPCRGSIRRLVSKSIQKFPNVARNRSMDVRTSMAPSVTSAQPIGSTFTPSRAL